MEQKHKIDCKDTQDFLLTALIVILGFSIMFYTAYSIGKRFQRHTVSHAEKKSSFKRTIEPAVFELPGFGDAVETENCVRVKAITKRHGVVCLDKPNGVQNNRVLKFFYPYFVLDFFPNKNEKNYKCADFFLISVTLSKSSALGWVKASDVEIWETRMGIRLSASSSLHVYATKEDVIRMIRTGSSLHYPVASVQPEKNHAFMPWSVLDSEVVEHEGGKYEIFKIAFLGKVKKHALVVDMLRLLPGNMGVDVLFLQEAMSEYQTKLAKDFISAISLQLSGLGFFSCRTQTATFASKNKIEQQFVDYKWKQGYSRVAVLIGGNYFDDEKRIKSTIKYAKENNIKVFAVCLPSKSWTPKKYTFKADHIKQFQQVAKETGGACYKLKITGRKTPVSTNALVDTNIMESFRQESVSGVPIFYTGWVAGRLGDVQLVSKEIFCFKSEADFLVSELKRTKTLLSSKDFYNQVLGSRKIKYEMMLKSGQVLSFWDADTPSRQCVYYKALCLPMSVRRESMLDFTKKKLLFMPEKDRLKIAADVAHIQEVLSRQKQPSPYVWINEKNLP